MSLDYPDETYAGMGRTLITVLGSISVSVLTSTKKHEQKIIGIDAFLHLCRSSGLIGLKIALWALSCWTDEFSTDQLIKFYHHNNLFTFWKLRSG